LQEHFFSWAGNLSPLPPLSLVSPMSHHALDFSRPLHNAAASLVSEEGGAELSAIFAIVSTLNARLSPQEIVDVLCLELQPFIRFDSLFVSLVRGERLEMIAGSGRTPFSAFSVGRGHKAWQLLEDGGLWSDDDCLEEFGEWGVGAFINVPLGTGGRGVGILHFDACKPRQWTHPELRLARVVGELVAAVIESAELLRQRDLQSAAHAEASALLRAIQEASAEGICLVSAEGQLLSYNRRFTALWHIDPVSEESLARNDALMSHVLAQLADPDEFLATVSDLWEHPEALARHEISLIDGRVFERYSAPAISPETSDSPSHYFGRIWTFSDITERKRTERQLARQAYYDAVTGLPNRVLFCERLSRALHGLSRGPKRLGVLFLDLDRFKIINDSLGHESGDQLLVQVAGRLHESLRPGDTAARFGGDEFVVLLEDIAGTDAAVAVADRIALALGAPFHIGEHSDVSVTASIGIVVASDSGESPDEILRKADVAMYRAKNGGKARSQLFSESLSLLAVERLQLELELASALKRGEIEVFYQPILDLETNCVGAFEALIRWHRAGKGIVSPAEFISIAEESDLIVSLGEYVTRIACEQACAWNREFGLPVVMHVNLSARQFEKGELVAQIARILSETGLPATQLMVEITESALMSDPHNAALQLELLKETGVCVAVDDFGIGYSSLAYLECFPLDLLKIDRSFVARLESSQTLVRAVASLGHAMGLQIVAEGIETTAQLEAVRGLGCRWGQGYLFSRPIPAREAGIFFRDSLCAANSVS